MRHCPKERKQFFLAQLRSCSLFVGVSRNLADKIRAFAIQYKELRSSTRATLFISKQLLEVRPRGLIRFTKIVLKRPTPIVQLLPRVLIDALGAIKRNPYTLLIRSN